MSGEYVKFVPRKTKLFKKSAEECEKIFQAWETDVNRAIDDLESHGCTIVQVFFKDKYVAIKYRIDRVERML